MSEPSKHTVFSAADIERYHNGSMPPRERHTLEMAALNDPFLADALEGYTYTTTPQHDLSKLNERLNEKLRNKKSSPFLSSQSAWLKVAAILLLLAGGGWLVYTNLRSPQTNVASTPKPMPQLKKVNQTVNAIEATPSHAINSNSKDTVGASPDAPIPIESPSPQPVITKAEQSKRGAEATVASNHTRETDEQALAHTNVATIKAGAATAATPPQAYRATAKQSLVVANEDSSAVATNYQSSPDTLKLNIVLKEDKTSLSEVVVVNKALKRQTKAKSPISAREAEPADGWDTFSGYIAGRLDEPDLKGKYSGEVELSFKVNRKGKPVNIVVTKSQCNQCDETAILLLKEGPKWKKKAKKGKVTIHFK